MTAPPEITAPRPKRARRVVQVLLVLVALALAASAVAAWSQGRTQHGPADAVREYVELLAAGDAEAASDLVDPSGFRGYAGSGAETALAVASPGSPRTGGDADLVIDRAAMIDAAALSEEHLEITGVDAAAPEVTVGATVDVVVGYRVAGTDHESVLRAERLDDTWYGFTRWRVVDPLAVPALVSSPLPQLGPARIGGSSVGVAVSGPGLDGAQQRATLLYPGVYTLEAASTPYLEVGASTVVVAAGARTAVLSSLDVVPVHLPLTPSARLEQLVRERADAYVERCLDPSVASADAACPAALRVPEGSRSNIEVTTRPEVVRLETYAVTWSGIHPDLPPLRALVSPGVVEFTVPGGRRDSAAFHFSAWIAPSGEDVAIELRPEYPWEGAERS